MATNTQVTSRGKFLQRILQNHIILFTGSRYLGYGLQLIRGIWVAQILGPYFFGVWGFLMLVQQYLSYTSLGMQYAVNVELATAAEKDITHKERIIHTAFTATVGLTFVLILSGLVIQIFALPLFAKYSFNQYAFAISLIAGLLHIRQVLTNVYRIYGQLGRIAVTELFEATVILLAALWFRGEQLIFAQLGAMVLSGLFGVVVFLYNPPFQLAFSFDRNYTQQMIKMGIPLLIYNLSFQLITMSARTLISIFYSVETMGYYSLANTITTATLLGLNAITWVIFPNVLANVRDGLPLETVKVTVQKVNTLYSTAVFLLVFGFIITLPLLFLVLPQYKDAGAVLETLLLSQAVLAVSFGYNCVAIARKQQLQVAVISMVAVVVVVAVGLLTSWLQWGFVWVAVGVLLGAFVFTIWQAQVGIRLVSGRKPTLADLMIVFPWASLVAVLCFLLGNMTNGRLLWQSIGLAIFVGGNLRELQQLRRFALHKLMG